MSDLIPIKKSHITFYNKYPLYYISKDGEPVLYKKADKKLDNKMLDKNQYPQFFIHKDDEAAVVKKLLSVFNVKLAKAISSKGISAIKQGLCQIVEEVLQGPIEATATVLPETLEILFFEAEKNPDFIEALTSMNANSSKITEHSVNVLALATQYCFFKNYSGDKIKTIGLCALLHDVGTAHIDKKIIESDDKLSDKDFATLQTHTTLGYKKIKAHPDFDRSIAMTALEHHELLDGSGYPKGATQITFEGQLIGLIDSYEPLKYSDKSFRKALKPYEALQIIKEDVIKGKYNKQIFVDLCSCLIK